MDFDYQVDDPNALLRMLYHIPAGTNLNTHIQYAQFRSTGELKFIDYGQDKNLEKYESETAPEIRLQDIQIPVVIFSAITDNVVSREDTQFLSDKIPTLVGHYWYEGHHASFLMSYSDEHLTDLFGVLNEFI
jgi:hypothetical protein